MPLTDTPLDWDRLVLIAGGHSAFQLLWAGLELGLYEKLSAEPGRTLDEVAQLLGLERYPTRVLMVGLTALGLVELDSEGRYRNAKLVDERLVPGKVGYAAPILGWQAQIVYPGLQDFVASLKQCRNVGLDRFAGDEPTLYQRLTHNKDLQTVFQDAMSALSSQANAFLQNAFDFSRFKHVVDAGGGDGTNAMAIARRYSTVRVQVFDSAAVCEHARENIRRAGMENRVGTWPGNFFEDAFPADVDCILYCHILTIWSMENNAKLLKRTFDALPSGGAVVIFNMMASDDDRGPLSTALGSPYFLAIATGEGMLHPWKDYEVALRTAGFREIRRIDQGLPLDHGILVGIK